MITAIAQNNLLRHGHWHPLFDASPFPAAFSNSRHGFAYINPAFETFYGKKLRQVVGLTPWILLPKGHPVKPVRDLRRKLEREGYWEGEFSNINAAGKTVRIHLIVIALRSRGSCEPNAYLSLAAPVKEGAQLLPALARQIGTFWLEESARVKLPISAESPRGERQEEIMRLTRMGYSTKEVAVFMGIATSTVANVKWKLGRRGAARKRH